jgi:hypothetical protein
MSEQRVTLSDFYALQETLLQTRTALYESRSREASCQQQLETMRSHAASASFPPPPARRMKAPAPASQYPDALNPFATDTASGDGGGSHRGTSHHRGAASSHSSAIELREAAIQATLRAAQWRVAAGKRELVRLTFHAWRAAHAQTCILRNMMLQARAGSATVAIAGEQPSPLPPPEPVVPRALRRLLESSGSPDEDGDERARASAEWELLCAELGRLEGEHAACCRARDGLRRRYDAATAALDEMTATAGALYGRGLCALDQQRGS